MLNKQALLILNKQISRLYLPIFKFYAKYRLSTDFKEYYKQTV